MRSAIPPPGPAQEDLLDDCLRQFTRSDIRMSPMRTGALNSLVSGSRCISANVSRSAKLEGTRHAKENDSIADFILRPRRSRFVITSPFPKVLQFAALRQEVTL